MNNEPVEGGMNPAAESLPETLESREMPEMATVNGGTYLEKAHRFFAETFHKLVGGDKETSEDMSATTLEVYAVAEMAKDTSLSEAAQKEARKVSVASAFAATDIEEAAAQAVQAIEAQQIVAETEGKKGILESLSEHKKKMMAALALIFGLSAAAPSFAQQRNVDWGRIAETAVLIGGQIARERSHVDLGGDTQQEQRGNRDYEREARNAADTRYETSELGSKHRFDRERFISNRDAELDRMKIEGRSQRDIQLHQRETKRVLDEMTLVQRREREAFEIRMGHRVEHGRIGSQKEGREIETNRGYGHGRIDIEKRNIEVQQGVQIFRQIFGR